MFHPMLLHGTGAEGTLAGMVDRFDNKFDNIDSVIEKAIEENKEIIFKEVTKWSSIWAIDKYLMLRFEIIINNFRYVRYVISLIAWFIYCSHYNLPDELTNWSNCLSSWRFCRLRKIDISAQNHHEDHWQLCATQRSFTEPSAFISITSSIKNIPIPIEKIKPFRTQTKLKENSMSNMLNYKKKIEIDDLSKVSIISWSTSKYYSQ